MEGGPPGRFYVGEIGGMSVNYDMPNIRPRVSIHSQKGEMHRLAQSLQGPAPPARPTQPANACQGQLTPIRTEDAASLTPRR